ncbi:hypothetical protein FEM48_Zijuj01G0122800 [Ziziphus jujuba var. spinosa]|uniref:Pectate lyase n=1 Tax=Ziziphus jujuba var. spinosa TaxID=714518 RepID=A0A978W178_ZIZJJ|nr:hypothetical protein FEM48_Zijuj01G0122800 [Ziziphus jujuba var. spinosa]
MASITHFLFLSCFLTHIVSTFQASPTASGYDTPEPISSYIYGITSKTNTMNVIDSCWQSKPNWANNRQALADCAVGFGKDAMGGKYGKIYLVTSPADDPVNPKPGTLRYGVIQTQPLWIIFAKDMVITLKNELIVNSFKTIDGRGAKVEIANGPCITVQGVSHVIIHGISIHDCKPGYAGLVRSSPTHVGQRLGSDGDAISIFGSSHVWVDHCFMARCTDGLVDVIHASTAITISNNYFSQHDKSCVYRVRFGYAHVANNRYDEWQMYALGGSANPTIFSEGNYFVAPNNINSKEVTKREVKKGWKDWKWRSSNDVFKNGAYFVQSGWGSCYPLYTPTQSFKVAPGDMVPALTSTAGPLPCVVGKAC